MKKCKIYNTQQFIHCYIILSFFLNERFLYSMFLNFIFSMLFYSTETYLFKTKTNKFLLLLLLYQEFSLCLTKS